MISKVEFLLRHTITRTNICAHAFAFYVAIKCTRKRSVAYDMQRDRPASRSWPSGGSICDFLLFRRIVDLDRKRCDWRATMFKRGAL
jgi:hypothetical protein